MKTFEIKVGRSVLRWDSPYDYVVPLAKKADLGGAFASIEEALDRPLGSPCLEELSRDAEKIVIIVPDITRGWCRAPEMNAALRRRIASVSKAPVTWIVATGQHRGITAEEAPLVYGDAPLPGDSLMNHNCDDAKNVKLTTSRGTPIWLNTRFCDADLVVMTGGITYHDMAGFSGGRKSIIPGVAGRRSIVANHNYCLIDGNLNPATDSGLIEGNPMAQDQKEFADLALRGKKCFILNAVADSLGQPAAWVAGDLWQAWEQGCQTCRALDSLYIPRRAARCIASCGGSPFDMDLYQATKAFFFAPFGFDARSARRACRRRRGQPWPGRLRRRSAGGHERAGGLRQAHGTRLYRLGLHRSAHGAGSAAPPLRAGHATHRRPLSRKSLSEHGPGRPLASPGFGNRRIVHAGSLRQRHSRDCRKLTGIIAPPLSPLEKRRGTVAPAHSETASRAEKRRAFC